MFLAFWLARAGGGPILLREDEEVLTTTFPPGPPQILGDEAGDLQEMEMEDYEDLEDFRIRQSGEISVEIEAFVSQSPTEDLSQEEREKNGTSSDSDYENILKTLEVEKTDLSLVLTWWQVAIIALGRFHSQTESGIMPDNGWRGRGGRESSVVIMCWRPGRAIQTH